MIDVDQLPETFGVRVRLATSVWLKPARLMPRIVWLKDPLTLKVT